MHMLNVSRRSRLVYRDTSIVGNMCSLCCCAWKGKYVEYIVLCCLISHCCLVSGSVEVGAGV